MRMKPSSEKIEEWVHTQLQLHNQPYMEDSADFSWHVEEKGEVVAGIVAE